MKPDGLQMPWSSLDLCSLSVAFKAPFPWTLEYLVALQGKSLAAGSMPSILGVCRYLNVCPPRSDGGKDHTSIPRRLCGQHIPCMGRKSETIKNKEHFNRGLVISGPPRHSENPHSPNTEPCLTRHPTYPLLCFIKHSVRGSLCLCDKQHTGPRLDVLGISSSSKSATKMI